MAKILIVDDDLDVVEVGRVILEGEGYQVVTANNREDGMAAVKAENPNLILLDVMMEREDDGFVMAQDLRRAGNNTPIIMMTNVSKVFGRQFGADSEMVPVNEFVEKPVDPQTLKALVKKHLA